MKLLPDTFMSGAGHIQDVAWCLPAMKNIQVKCEVNKLDKLLLLLRIHRTETYLVFMGSSYMIPLAISLTDIRADRGELKVPRISFASLKHFALFCKVNLLMIQHGFTAF